MSGRRAFLKLLGGGSLAAASGVSTKQAAEALGVPLSGLSTDPMPTEAGGVGVAQLGPHPALRALWREEDISARASSNHLPVHIQSKKSWSPAFKSHVAMREKAIMDEFRDRLERDAAFAQKITRLMGLSND